jgi:hypothetical protein
VRLKRGSTSTWPEGQKKKEKEGIDREGSLVREARGQPVDPCDRQWIRCYTFLSCLLGEDA